MLFLKPYARIIKPLFQIILEELEYGVVILHFASRHQKFTMK